MLVSPAVARTRDIRTNQVDVACDICGRTLLRGEHAESFLAGGARRRLEQQYNGLLRATASVRDDNCVLVKKRERVIVLRPEDIDFVEAYGDYVRLRVGTETHLLRGTLADMERRLKREGFMRIHRSRLVNWRRASEA